MPANLSEAMLVWHAHVHSHAHVHTHRCHPRAWPHTHAHTHTTRWRPPSAHTPTLSHTRASTPTKPTWLLILDSYANTVSTGIPLEFTNLKKYQFSGSWCVYTPKIHHAWVSKTNSLRPTTLVALLHLQWRVVCALYFMVWLPLVDPNLFSPF